MAYGKFVNTSQHTYLGLSSQHMKHAFSAAEVGLNMWNFIGQTILTKASLANQRLRTWGNSQVMKETQARDLGIADIPTRSDPEVSVRSRRSQGLGLANWRCYRLKSTWNDPIALQFSTCPPFWCPFEHRQRPFFFLPPR